MDHVDLCAVLQVKLLVRTRVTFQVYPTKRPDQPIPKSHNPSVLLNRHWADSLFSKGSNISAGLSQLGTEEWQEQSPVGSRPVLGAPALDEAHADGAHAGQLVHGLEALVHRLRQQSSELLVVKNLQVTACGKEHGKDKHWLNGIENSISFGATQGCFLMFSEHLVPLSSRDRN